MLSQSSAKALIQNEMFPAYLAEKEELDRIDRWLHWDHDQPHSPAAATNEYKEIISRAQTPWGDLIVSTLAQALKTIGYRSAKTPDDVVEERWRWWKQNQMPAKQIGLYRAACGYGQAYNLILPGTDGRGKPTPVITSLSPRNFITFDGDIDLIDDFPAFGLRVDVVGNNPLETEYLIRLYDDTSVYWFGAGPEGNGLTYITTDEHGMGVCPVARYLNIVDLEGRTDGEIAPVIPLLGAIDQSKFDRMVVQRFQSFQVRWIAGMDKPETDEEQRAAAMRLRAEDLLVSESGDTKFGVLPTADLNGLIAAKESDIRDLAAIKQVPAHWLTGTLTNIGAEAVAAAMTTFQWKVDERKTSYGVGNQATFRLGALAMGDLDGFYDFDSEVKWADNETRSFSQAADALGKLAQMLKVPVEMLWERIPGFEQDDVERAKELVQDGDSVDQLIAQVMQDRAVAQAEAMPTEPDDPAADQQQ